MHRIVAPASAPCVDGGLGRPHVLADLDVEHEIGHAACGEHEIGAEGHGLPGQRGLATGDAEAGREPSMLVVLAVVGQECLRHRAGDAAVRDDHGAVVQALVAPHRRADDEGARELARRRHEVGDRALHAVEQRLLQEEVVDRVGRQPELGEQHEVDRAFLAFAQEFQSLAGITRGIADGDPRRARGDPHHALAMDGKE